MQIRLSTFQALFKDEVKVFVVRQSVLQIKVIKLFTDWYFFTKSHKKLDDSDNVNLAGFKILIFWKVFKIFINLRCYANKTRSIINMRVNWPILNISGVQDASFQKWVIFRSAEQKMRYKIKRSCGSEN